MLLFLKSFFRAKMWKPKKTIKDKFVILDAFLTQLKETLRITISSKLQAVLSR